MKVSCPGSLMLFGEHAVLQGKHALSCAIDKRLSVELRKRPDDQVVITSSLGSYITSLPILTVQAPFSFILQAVADIKDILPSGFDLTIQSEMSPLFGLGTSSAVTAATTAALLLFTEGHFDKRTLFDRTVTTIRRVQKVGSGADAAASIYGGIVFYCMDTPHIEKLDGLFDLTVVYSGSKMATPEVIAKVHALQQKRPELYATLFSAIDDIAKEAKEMIHSPQCIGELFNLQQGLMDALGVNNAALSEIVYLLRKDPQVYGSKISGSGLGDCVIGLGKASKLITHYPVLSVAMSEQGVIVE